MLSVRLRVSLSVAPISSTPAPAMSEARTRWARVTLERFDRADGFVWVMVGLMERATTTDPSRESRRQSCDSVAKERQSNYDGVRAGASWLARREKRDQSR